MISKFAVPVIAVSVGLAILFSILMQICDWHVRRVAFIKSERKRRCDTAAAKLRAKAKGQGGTG